MAWVEDFMPNKGKNWTAEVVVVIRGADHLPVSGATVSGLWGGGVNGSGSCTTDAAGTCAINKAVKSNLSSVTFTVDSVLHATLTYDAAGNDMAAGITLAKP